MPPHAKTSPRNASSAPWWLAADSRGEAEYAAHLALNLRQHVAGFSLKVREIFDSFLFDDTIRDLASNEGVARTVNDCCYGTGGMLTITKDRIPQITPPGQGRC